VSEWVRITISIRKPTAQKVIRIKNASGLSYDALFNEYIRLKAILAQQNKDAEISNKSVLYALNTNKRHR